MVEMLDDCYHLRWYSDASEYLPQEGSVDGVVRPRKGQMFSTLNRRSKKGKGGEGDGKESGE